MDCKSFSSSKISVYNSHLLLVRSCLIVCTLWRVDIFFIINENRRTDQCYVYVISTRFWWALFCTWKVALSCSSRNGIHSLKYSKFTNYFRLWRNRKSHAGSQFFCHSWFTIQFSLKNRMRNLMPNADTKPSRHLLDRCCKSMVMNALTVVTYIVVFTLSRDWLYNSKCSEEQDKSCWRENN